ncbi:MAG: oligosaccharide flippase family protein [Gaiellaceae bacterium MAG52_C11]|nr:oligosaccharide flippase family protein [Candidatus Gaiellasilicea maunaloa]
MTRFLAALVINGLTSVVRGLSLGGQIGDRASVFGQGAGNALLNGTAFVVNFATTLLLSRLLGPDGFGAYAFAFSLALLLSVPARLGFTTMLVREITEYRLSESWGSVRGILRRANQSVLIASVVVCAVAAAYFSLIGWPEGDLHRPSLLALPLVPLIAVTSVRQGVMQGFGRVVLGRAPETAIMPAVLLVVAGVLSLGLGNRFSASWAVVAADVSGVVAVVVGIVFLRRVLPAEARSSTPDFETRRWAQAVRPLIVLSLVSTAGGQLPTLLLGAFSDPSEVGIYNVAFRIAGVLPFLLIAMTPALMPAVVELRTLERHDELQRLLTRSARIILLFTALIGLVAIAFATPLLQIFGSEFEGGETALRVLAIGHIASIACGLPGMVLMMTGDANAMTMTFLATTVVTLALAVALVPGYGASGGAIATAAGLVASNAIMSVILYRRRGIYAPALPLPRGLGSAER